MTDMPREIPAFEHGRLRIWGFDGDSGKGRELVAALSAEPRDAGLPQALLGARRLDPYWLDLVNLGDISELGLGGYLHQGYDVPQDRLAAIDLETAASHVLIAPSRAFADTEQTLAPDPVLEPLAVIDLEEDVGALRPMGPVASARRGDAPDSTARPGPPAGRGLRPSAILILVLIAAAFIAIVAL